MPNRAARFFATATTATGTVQHWTHVRGFGKVLLDDGTTALVARTSLRGGFYVNERDRVRGKLVTSETAGSKLHEVTREDGSLIRPRALRGEVVCWDDLLLTGQIAEYDLTGKLHPNSPKFQFSVEDYECDVPRMSVGLRVCFCLRNNRPARVVFDYRPVKGTESKGRIREIRGTYGFLNEANTNNSIYFAVSSFLDPVQVGDTVTFKLGIEPPVSHSAGKKVAFAIQKALD